ncbi:branched-chain amino acid ABC transporter permease [Aeromicrobium sp. Leaf350]|uniref:branched-chain amino acid ABC transporter permease n=1 Tax=Aeromicrobium sp. Leaf350 TaxID=2876565 RepID=UPI001E2A9B5D|nr:branched-chain amino acid ABC transporter permease [Aeromicrobium sp. Leaf350]
MDFMLILRDSLSAAVGPAAIVYALAAIGLNVHFGYAGLLNFGQAGFMLVGAYGLAVSAVVYDVPFVLALVIGILASVVLAVILGVPTLRLRADYLAIATIATAEVIRFIVNSPSNADVTRGSQGIAGFAKPFHDLNPYGGGLDIGIVRLSRSDLWSATVGWVLVAICCLIVYLLMRSPWGRVLRSIREDEEAVRSLGKNVFAYKMQALILGGVFGGLAGIFLALRQASTIPSDFGTHVTFYAYTALLIGGAARVLGPVVGAMIFWFLLNGLGTFFGQLTSGADPILPEGLMDQSQASLVRFIVVGLGLMLLLIFRPQGIFGDRKELAIDAR